MSQTGWVCGKRAALNGDNLQIHLLDVRSQAESESRGGALWSLLRRKTIQGAGNSQRITAQVNTAEDADMETSIEKAVADFFEDDRVKELLTKSKKFDVDVESSVAQQIALAQLKILTRSRCQKDKT